jgi:exopolyphosphatase/guanosine-5'-triphosphate,3'-diphosphate pyrophosphatase
VPREGVYAAIDLGTNNCRLLVARPVGAGFEVLDSFSRIVRLGEGLNETGRLADAATERTLAALRVCAGKVRQWGIPPERLRAVATAACRRAANGAEFLAKAERATGIAFDVIGTEEEAELAMLGCVPLLERDRANALVIDIGGGSTELAWARRGAAGGRDWEIEDLLCLPHGVVTLSEAHAGAGYRAMVEAMRPALEAFDRRLRINREVSVGAVQMLGTSGTVTTLAALHLDLPRYDRARVDGSFITFEQVRAVTDALVAQSEEERATHPCIGADRADLVVAGCAILQAICEQWPVGRLRVADRGLREGILLQLMEAA